MRSITLILALVLLAAVGGCSPSMEKSTTEAQAKDARSNAEAHCKDEEGYDYGSKEYEQCMAEALEQ